MFITSEAFNPLLGDMNQLFSQGINERFAHEIAHQYWGQVVKMPSDEEQWLTEAFAEYCAAVFLKTHRDPSIYKTLEKYWKRGADFANDAGPIPLANRIYDPVTGFEIRTGLLYDKGPLLLAALNKEVGDEVFFTFLKSYQKTFAWKFGTTKHVAGLLQHLTKKDYMPFFEKYYWGTAMPPPTESASGPSPVIPSPARSSVLVEVRVMSKKKTWDWRRPRPRSRGSWCSRPRRRPGGSRVAPGTSRIGSRKVSAADR